jgi:hypothetical protein
MHGMDSIYKRKLYMDSGNVPEKKRKFGIQSCGSSNFPDEATQHTFISSI